MAVFTFNFCKTKNSLSMCVGRGLALSSCCSHAVVVALAGASSQLSSRAYSAITGRAFSSSVKEMATPPIERVEENKQVSKTGPQVGL